FDTSARNPVKEILLKLNLPDHRSILTDSKMEVKELGLETYDKTSLAGLLVMICLLDPPQHKFLPEDDLEQIFGDLTKDTGMTEDDI
ncbi:pyruvate, phosphate dikinase, partial [Tanacetum coccineum]